MKINLHDKMPLQDNEQKMLVWENNSSVEFPLTHSHTCYYITINCYRVFNFSVNDGLTYYHQQVFAQSYIYNDQYWCCSLLDIILSNYSTFYILYPFIIFSLYIILVQTFCYISKTNITIKERKIIFLYSYRPNDCTNTYIGAECTNEIRLISL